MHKFKYIQLFYKVKKKCFNNQGKNTKKIRICNYVILTKEYDINIQT